MKCIESHKLHSQLLSKLLCDNSPQTILEFNQVLWLTKHRLNIFIPNDTKSSLLWRLGDNLAIYERLSYLSFSFVKIMKKINIIEEPLTIKNKKIDWVFNKYTCLRVSNSC
jgi:hypothetical protein